MWGLIFTFYSPEELERQLRSFGFYVPEQQVLEPGDWRSELYILARDALIQNNRAKNGMEKIQITIQNYRDAIDSFQNGAEVSINNEQVKKLYRIVLISVIARAPRTSSQMVSIR